MDGFTFDLFQAINVQRCEQCFHALDAWTPTDWALAIAGETGELCNMIKKVRRGDYPLTQVRPLILAEAADVICYTDLLISRLGANTHNVLLAKFNEVSRKVGYKQIG